jgi:hypothetical protein
MKKNWMISTGLWLRVVRISLISLMMSVVVLTSFCASHRPPVILQSDDVVIEIDAQHLKMSKDHYRKLLRYIAELERLLEIKQQEKTK